MANDLYNYANQFTLGQLFRGGQNALQGAANFLNQAGIGTNRMGLPIQSRPVVNPEFMRPDYSGAGERARRFQEYKTGRDIPGANTDYSARLGAGSSSAADRAYQQEASRVAQLTAQDPELQRYEKARASAKSQQEMDAARDIGMAIWARSNPELAKKVKPGQSGYEVIQNEINAGQMGPVKDFPFDTTRPLSPTPVPPEQRNVTYQGASPVPIPGAAPVVPVAFGTPQTQMYENFRQAIAPGASLQSSPLGGSPITNIPSYGAQLGNPLGTAVDTDAFRSDKARELAELFKNAQMVR